MKTRSIFQFVRYALGLVLVYSLVLGTASPARADGMCYVNAAATGKNDGTSWTDAYNSLQSALGALPCNEVWVAKGIYKPTGGTDRTISFVLRNNLALYGGFAGAETLVDQRNFAANPTILSGDIGTPGDLTDNSYHVVIGSGTDRTARLDGFTIRGGNADAGGPPGWGGAGIFSDSGSPSLANLIFSDNAAAYGAGMLNDKSSPGLTNVKFIHGAATGGGGMYNVGSSPSLLDVTFADNAAGPTGGGGGMYNDGSSDPVLTNVTFSGNTAQAGGGMLNVNNSSPILTNVTFSGNTGSLYGGGISNWNGSGSSLRHVTFSGNTSPHGAAIHHTDSGATVIVNSILYGDTGAEIEDTSGTLVITDSIVQGGYAGTGNLDANPLLGPLANNGGFTQTHALGFGSPAIDKGTNTGCPPKDQRGVTRPQDGDGNGTAICDMGATESRILSKSFQSMGARDGWVLESAETSGAGGTMNTAATGISVGDDAADRQYRGILSFNTSLLPDNARITSAMLRIKRAGVVGTDPFGTHGNLLVDVRKGAFSGNVALQPVDFQALASKNAVMTVLNNPVNGWYSKAMPAASFVYINKTGITQFRLRFTKDDNDDLGADVLKFYSGNALTASLRPQLVIKYYLP